MKIDKSNPVHWLLLLRQGCYTLLAICLRPFRRRNQRPVVILYGHQLSGNLKALYEQWRQTHREKLELYFLSLDPEYSKKLADQGIRVLRCSRLRDMLFLGRCDAMITDHGLHAMAPLVRWTDIRFIDVWHGIPFKGFVPNDFRVQHRYDEVWVSSPMLKQIYIEKFGFPADIVKPIGYARVDRLFRGDPPTVSFRALAGIPADTKLILFAPTWQQDDSGRELFPFGQAQDEFIRRLCTVCKQQRSALVIRSHLNAQISKLPYDNLYYASMKEYPDTESLLMEADVLICDWSSISFDYLTLNRPTLFLDVPPPFKNGLSLGPEYRFGCIVPDMDYLCDALREAIAEPETYHRKYYETHEKVTNAVFAHTRDQNSSAIQLECLASRSIVEKNKVSTNVSSR
jgi:CDP-glycerol glycerophosphotransferase